MTPAQALHFSSQIAVKAMDLAGQQRLLEAKVAIIGVGGLGCHAATTLAASGIGQITLIDGDQIEASNLARQTLYRLADIGQFKARCAQRALSADYPHLCCRCYSTPLDQNNMQALLEGHQLVLDCSDNQTTRELVSDFCLQSATPLISAAAIQGQAQMFCRSGEPRQACYRCVSQHFSQPAASCVEAGVLTPLVIAMGAQQALFAVNYLAGIGALPVNTLMLYDGLQHQWQHFSIAPNARCRLCNP